MANIVTCCRILCSMAMLFLHMPSMSFIIMYMLCGLTDMLDGIIARKTNTVSDFGARLDTSADFLFVAVLLIKIFSGNDIPMWLWIWIGAITCIKIANMIYGFVYMKRLMVEHTIMNKVTGVLLFLLPLTLSFVELKYSSIVVCLMATFSAIQEGHYIRERRVIV